MNPFDPRTLGIEKSEFDAAIAANPALLEQFPEAREYAESLNRQRDVLAMGEAVDDGDIPGILADDEDAPFVLEFALSRGGEILAISSLASEVPEGIPEWAWQAYLEGLVVRARGRAALRVVEEEGRIAGLFADEDEAWDEVDDLEHRMALDPRDPMFLDPRDGEGDPTLEDPLF